MFDPSLENTHYKAKNFGEHVHIQPGAAVGPKNGLSILLDTETFDYSFHLRASEGFKVKLGSVLFTNASSLIPNVPGNSMLLLQVAVHHHLDQPIMTIKELDVAPGSLVQVAVTPTLTSTSQVPGTALLILSRYC